MSTIIIGAGIIGTSIAYYLSESSADPSAIHIIESSSRLFASASGYAAGFLAKDWFPHAAAELGVLSFALHEQLAKEHDGGQRWGYAPSTALSLGVEKEGGDGGGRAVRGEDWLLDGTSRAEVAIADGVKNEDGIPAWLTKQDGGSLDVISGKDGCAQVDPRRLCEFLMESCQARGVQVHYPAQVVSVNKDEEGSVLGVKLISGGDDVPKELACKNIVIASGAWTPAVFKKLFPNSTISIPISPLAGHSLLIQSPRHSLLDEEKYGGSHAIFSAPTKNYSWAPELFSRRGGDIYIAGLNDATIPLPKLATGAIIADDSMAELKKAAIQLLGRATLDDNRITEDDLDVRREALCFRPVTKRGTPIIAKVSDCDLGEDIESPGGGGGIYVVAGHGLWGISLSLGSGKVVAEMICCEKTSADISELGL